MLQFDLQIADVVRHTLHTSGTIINVNLKYGSVKSREFHISHDASRLISVFSLRWKERSRVSREILNDLNFKTQLIQGKFQ